MTDEEGAWMMENTQRIEALVELVKKINEQANTAREAIQLLKQISELQSKRLDNIENWLSKMKPVGPN